MRIRIPTTIGIAILLAPTIALGVFTLVMTEKISVQIQESVYPSSKKTGAKAHTVAGEKIKEQNCLDSGGTVATVSCCGQTQNFPNNCAIGACGCAPTNSHQIKTCNCEPGECFDGNACVSK
jgi:hypothetical protein